MPDFGFVEHPESIEARFTVEITIKTNSFEVMSRINAALKQAGLFADATGAQYAWGYQLQRNGDVE
jgi:hypothetical protein